MRKLVCMLALMLGCSVPASAGTVYLKDGSRIEKAKAWREKGRVTVLVNRYSITSFDNSEVNLKRTFPVRKKKIRAAALPASVGAPAASAAAAPAQPPAATAQSTRKLALPKLPDKLPELSIPKSSQEGAIRRQKREMDQRLNE